MNNDAELRLSPWAAAADPSVLHATIAHLRRAIMRAWQRIQERPMADATTIEARLQALGLSLPATAPAPPGVRLPDKT
jgi:hypothetical protein